MKCNRSMVVLLALAAPALLAIASCATRTTAPDPALLEEQIASAKIEEIALVRSTIRDSGRAERFIGLLAERDRMLANAIELIAAHQERMNRLNADYHSERSAFEAQLTLYNGQRDSAQRALIDLMAQMKLATTDDEWHTISHFQAEHLDLRKLAYRGLASGG